VSDLPPIPDDDEVAEVLNAVGDGGEPTGTDARWFRTPGRRKRWPWVVMWIALLAVGVGGGFAVASVQLLGNTLEKASPDTPLVEAAVKATDPVLPDAPINILLLGSDKRAGKAGSVLAGFELPTETSCSAAVSLGAMRSSRVLRRLVTVSF
jgi:hypothetical protein